MYIIPKQEYRELKNGVEGGTVQSTSSSPKADSISDLNQSQVNNIEVTRGGTIVIDASGSTQDKASDNDLRRGGKKKREAGGGGEGGSDKGGKGRQQQMKDARVDDIEDDNERASARRANRLHISPFHPPRDEDTFESPEKNSNQPVFPSTDAARAGLERKKRLKGEQKTRKSLIRQIPTHSQTMSRDSQKIPALEAAKAGLERQKRLKREQKIRRSLISQMSARFPKAKKTPSSSFLSPVSGIAKPNFESRGNKLSPNIPRIAQSALSRSKRLLREKKLRALIRDRVNQLQGRRSLSFSSMVDKSSALRNEINKKKPPHIEVTPSTFSDMMSSTSIKRKRVQSPFVPNKKMRGDIAGKRKRPAERFVQSKKLKTKIQGGQTKAIAGVKRKGERVRKIPGFVFREVPPPEKRLRSMNRGEENGREEREEVLASDDESMSPLPDDTLTDDGEYPIW